MKNKNIQPQVNFPGSYKKEYYIEGLIVCYRNEIWIKHMSNDCRHVIHNQHMTHRRNVNTWKAPTSLILRDYFWNDQFIVVAILDCTTAHEEGYDMLKWKYQVHLNLCLLNSKIKKLLYFLCGPLRGDGGGGKILTAIIR